MTDAANIGYWFSAGDTLPHGDGRKIVIGETLCAKGPLKLCKNGLHWSEHPFDALRYAPGPWLHKVRAGGETLRDDDKCCSRERTVLARIDATDMLRAYARSEALAVIHLWDCPEIVRRYLETGDENIRAAARAAAWAAAWVAARDAAWVAAWVAAWERFRVAVDAAFGEGDGR